MKKNKLNEAFNPKVLDDKAPFAIRESFNLLRTNLMYTIPDNENHAPVFAVTSESENAGKSTIISNIALSFAQLGQRVLLIDADLRCPVLHNFFDIDNTGGLSELMSGIEKDVIHKKVRENLDVVTSGRIPPNPSELITGPKFAEFLNSCKKDYDIIFVDFPPVGIVPDAVANCKNVTSYIFAVRSGRSSAKNVNSAIESMEKVGAKIAGIVLNDYDIKGTSYKRHTGAMYKYQSGTNSRYEKSSKKVHDKK